MIFGSYHVYDSSGHKLADVKSKSHAIQMARATSGQVRKSNGKVVYSATRNPVKKKKKKKAKKRPAAKKNKVTKKKKVASKSNPSKSLRNKLAKMKPHTWYNTKLSGVKMKVQRRGKMLILRPPMKRSK